MLLITIFKWLACWLKDFSSQVPTCRSPDQLAISGIYFLKQWCLWGLLRGFMKLRSIKEMTWPSTMMPLLPTIPHVHLGCRKKVGGWPDMPEIWGNRCSGWMLRKFVSCFLGCTYAWNVRTHVCKWFSTKNAWKINMIKVMVIPKKSYRIFVEKHLGKW